MVASVVDESARERPSSSITSRTFSSIIRQNDFAVDFGTECARWIGPSDGLDGSEDMYKRLLGHAFHGLGVSFLATATQSFAGSIPTRRVVGWAWDN